MAVVLLKGTLLDFVVGEVRFKRAWETVMKVADKLKKRHLATCFGMTHGKIHVYWSYPPTISPFLATS